MSVICRAPVAPIQADASLRAEQVTQLVLGETARVVERRKEWLRVQGDADEYEGWVHEGYVLTLARPDAAAWRASAGGWSDGAVVRAGTDQVRLPLRARVQLGPEGVRLPDGRVGTVVEGTVRDMEEVKRTVRTTGITEWAWAAFAGAPYQWGGVTPLGVDCSGLVQTTFAALGVALPRDAWQQAASGTEVPVAEMAAGDLCFFHGEATDRITHVALYAGNDAIVHSTVACGAVVNERWGAGSRAAGLRGRLVHARRVTPP
jgi:hypothetical protein